MLLVHKVQKMLPEKDGVLFDYNKDDKLIEISAPTQEDLEALFK